MNRKNFTIPPSTSLSAALNSPGFENFLLLMAIMIAAMFLPLITLALAMYYTDSSRTVILPVSTPREPNGKES